jgi:hypothetical protein
LLSTQDGKKEKKEKREKKEKKFFLRGEWRSTMADLKMEDLFSRGGWVILIYPAGSVRALAGVLVLFTSPFSSFLLFFFVFFFSFLFFPLFVFSIFLSCPYFFFSLLLSSLLLFYGCLIPRWVLVRVPAISVFK